MTVIWICPKCRHKNEELDDKMSDYWCANCGKPVDNVMNIYWEKHSGKPGPGPRICPYLPPDPRETC